MFDFCFQSVRRPDLGLSQDSDTSSQRLSASSQWVGSPWAALIDFFPLLFSACKRCLGERRPQIRDGSARRWFFSSCLSVDWLSQLTFDQTSGHMRAVSERLKKTAFNCFDLERCKTSWSGCLVIRITNQNLQIAGLASCWCSIERRKFRKIDWPNFSKALKNLLLHLLE